MQSFASSSCISTASNKSFKQREKDLYKSFIGVCKFKYIDYKNKHGDNCSHLTPSNFKSILHEQKIELPSYEDFKNGKNIVFAANGFSTTERSLDLNSTLLYADTDDALQQLQIKKEAVDRFQNVRNNIAPIMAPIDETIDVDDTTIDATLLFAVGDDFSFDINRKVEASPIKKVDPACESNNATMHNLIICEASEEQLSVDEVTCDTNNATKDNVSICVEPSIVEVQCIGLNQKVNLEDVNWHINKISEWRPNCGKNQFKVHYKPVNRKKYPP